jgi:hypothetical protein
MNKLSFTILFLISSITFAQLPMPPGAQLEKIATGFKFVEGPGKFEKKVSQFSWCKLLQIILK